MVVKKSGGKIFGAILTAAETKAMQMEVQRALAEYDEKNQNEIDAMILWNLHTQFGFGKKRLRRFYDAFVPELKALIRRYELGENDKAWVCTRQLEEYGIDIKEWNR